MLLVFWPLLAQGQNNETVKEYVTVKRVITNDSQNITISEEQSTQQIKGTVVVLGTVLSISPLKKKIQFNDTIMAQEQRIKDSLNQAKVAELKAARAAELEASIQAQNKKAEVQKKALEEAFKKQIEDLKAKRKALMKKPDNR